MDQEIAPEDLTITWESDKDGPLGSGLITSSGEVNFSSSELSANTHTILFTVQDELESTCSDGAEWHVRGRTAFSLLAEAEHAF